jgi:hypothetical protein
VEKDEQKGRVEEEEKEVQIDAYAPSGFMSAGTKAQK